MDIFYQAAPSGAESIASFWQSTLGITVITLVAGLIGIILGQFLQGRSQHKAWLLENRMKAFAELLKISEECMNKAEAYVQSLYLNGKEPNFDDKGLATDIAKRFESAFTQIRIVRLLLPDRELRKSLEQLMIDKVRLLCSPKFADKVDLAREIHIKDRKIQSILEEQLSYSNFITKLKSLLKRRV